MVSDPDLVQPPVTEVGYAGVNPPSWSMIAGSLVAGAEWQDPEEVPQLMWPMSVRTYHTMRTDSQIDALVKSIVLPMRRLRFSVKPNGAGDQAVEQAAADLSVPILGTDEPPPRGRRRFNHDDHLRHALLGLIYGHMFFEQVGEIGDDLMWRLTKLAPRMPQSLQKIEVAPDGGLTGIRQWGVYEPNSLAAKLLKVGILAAYVWDREGANWLGRSLLRPLYKHWLVKDRLIRIDTIRHERFGIGIPTGKAAPGGNPVEYARIAQSITASEQGGIGLPNGADIGVEGIRGTLPDTIASIRYHDEQMARDFLAMFVQLGQTETGSRALGETFVDFFDLSIQAVANWYCRVTTEHVIWDQVDWNFGPDENAPELVWERDDDVGALSVTDLVALIQNGGIAVDAETEAWIRDRWHLPEKVAATAPVQPPSTVAADRRRRADTSRLPFASTRQERTVRGEFDPDEERDDAGKWTSGGGTSGDGDTSEAATDHILGSGDRPLVEPISLAGTTYGDAAGKTVFAVEAADGQQVRMFVDAPKGQTPSSEQAREALNAVADLYDHFGNAGFSPPSVVIVSKDTASSYGDGIDAQAYVQDGYNSINLVGRMAWTGSQIGLMPRPEGISKCQSTIAHEYGHMYDFGSKNAGPNRVAMFTRLADEPKNGGMSRYGMTNRYEAYAEAFADNAMTNGESSRTGTIAYAEAFGWNS